MEDPPGSESEKEKIKQAARMCRLVFLFRIKWQGEKKTTVHRSLSETQGRSEKTYQSAARAFQRAVSVFIQTDCHQKQPVAVGKLFGEGESQFQLQAPAHPVASRGLRRRARTVSFEGVQPFAAVLGARRESGAGLAGTSAGA